MSDKFSIAEFENFIGPLYDSDDPIRHEMEAYAEEHDFPIIGPLAGHHLYQYALMIGARRVFELGSGYGYSALLFARAVGPEGVVHCTEFDADNIKRAEDYLSRAGVWERVTYHQQDAIAALREVGGTWDLIYNDIDKDAYPETIALAYEHLRPGGLFITDNVIWSGRTLRNEQDETTQHILRFTRELFAHEGFVTTILPVRDGLSVALRR